MAVCSECKQEMSGKAPATTCTVDPTVDFPDGTSLPAVPFDPAAFGEPGERCHDCNVMAGGLHHPGCDAERCPRCHGQLISCGCLDENE